MRKSASTGHLARFRPVDSEDFSQRAKNLAQFLGTSLVPTQELLACVFGYSNRHELQERLKTHGLAGPFNDQVESFNAALGSDGKSNVYELAETVRDKRDERLMRLASSWLKEIGRWDDSNRVALLCDLGLFSTAAAHRVAVKRVNAFLEGEPVFTDDGFPLGFKGTLFLRYQTDLPLAADGLASVAAAKGEYNLADFIYDPAQQLDVVRGYRMAHLFREMVFRSVPETLNGPYAVELELIDEALLPEGKPGEVLLTDPCSLIMAAFEDILEDSAGREFSDEEHRDIHRALYEPSKEPPCQWTLPLGQEDFRKDVARMKLDIRLQLADRLVNGIEDNEDSGQERLRLKQPAYLQLRKSNRCLSLLLEPQVTEDDIDRWRVSATLLLLDETSGLWSGVAAIEADYVVPDEYTDENDLIWNFENLASEDLATAWDVLATHYVPYAGFASYSEWAETGVAAANAFIWVDPKHRGTEVSKWLLEDFVAALGQHARSEDWMWRKWADVRERSNWDPETSYNEEDFDYPLTLPSLGVVLLYMPDSRIRGVSLWDAAQGTADVELRDSRDESLEPVFGKLWNASAHKEPDWALAKRLLNITQAIPMDFVLYDDCFDKGADDDDTEGGPRELSIPGGDEKLVFPKARY
jgi:GNAT superfamily N-acetyltransferase